LSANASTVATNGTVGLTAFVTESSGTPVQKRHDRAFHDDARHRDTH
jgi:hypothetical protein